MNNWLQSSAMSFHVCPDCDLIIKQVELAEQQIAKCPRCGTVVAKQDHDFINKSLAYSFAGLLFYVPANFLPILSFDILGLFANSTMFNGVFQLFEGGYYWMSLLVLMCSVILPLVFLSVVFISSLALKLNLIFKPLKRMLLWQQHLKEWAMLEVYMLSILIAYIKMGDMGHIATHIGLYCFIGMLISTTLTQINFNTANAFDYLEKLQQQKREQST